MNDKPYPIKALLVSGANPLVQWPNSSKVKEALEKLVIIDDADRQVPTPMPEADKLFDMMNNDGDVIKTDITGPNNQAYAAYKEHLEKRIGRPNPKLKITEILEAMHILCFLRL